MYNQQTFNHMSKSLNKQYQTHIDMYKSINLVAAAQYNSYESLKDDEKLTEKEIMKIFIGNVCTFIDKLHLKKKKNIKTKRNKIAP